MKENEFFFPQTSLAVVGFNTLVLIDLRSGRVLAEHSLPCYSARPPVMEDFSGDGWNDIIVTCQNGYV